MYDGMYDPPSLRVKHLPALPPYVALRCPRLGPCCGELGWTLSKVQLRVSPLDLASLFDSFFNPSGWW